MVSIEKIRGSNLHLHPKKKHSRLLFFYITYINVFCNHCKRVNNKFNKNTICLLISCKTEAAAIAKNIYIHNSNKHNRRVTLSIFNSNNNNNNLALRRLYEKLLKAITRIRVLYANFKISLLRNPLTKIARNKNENFTLINPTVNWPTLNDEKIQMRS